MSDDATATASPAQSPSSPATRPDLGRYLMPPWDRKIIQLALKLEGCPGRTPDGRYPVAASQEFVNQNFASANREAQPDKLNLELERKRPADVLGMMS